MKLLKFFLAMIAGLGLVHLVRFVAEVDDNETEEYDIYEEELEHPLFV